MAGIGRRRRETEMAVEGPGLVILRVNGKRADADDIGNLKSSAKRIEQKSRPNAFSLPSRANREAGQNEQWDRMTRHAFGDTLRRIRVPHLAGDDRIESYNRIAIEPNIGLRRIRLLSLKSVTNEKAVEFRLSAGEWFDGVNARQLFDAKRLRHDFVFGSKTDGSLNRRSRRT